MPPFGVALAAGPVGGVARSFAADEESATRKFVWWVALRDPRSVVRAAAQHALATSDGDAGLLAFLETDYPAAKRYAEERKAMNADFARRVLETHTAEFSPEVHAAARRAVNGTDADREWFARTGFAEAKERDRRARESSGEQARALVEADRNYVRTLATHDPGTQVRAAAAYAVRPAATDNDIVEFFAHDWASAAKLDLESYRLRLLDNEVAWRAAVNRLVADAQAAEKAAAEAAEEAKEQARAAAARAWRAAAERTAAPRSAWAEAQEVSARQAANWRQVAAAAQAATGPNWAAVANFSTSTEAQWKSEQEVVAEQARFWNALLQQALAGEQRVQSGKS
ncbi:hypothetical protein [Streptoalloteichus hindustanus]|uniref:Uncharacterized protein n=1 Tax=Streptoalloteichus hindustanus TaxID=2017 RepID=A0A1M5BPG0_STRHI|nr:hypothetical protein [Streptoalloteichus hindustanus]SHF44513.1 Short repeat-containing protein of unknown function [Streptoalloteichus hindustanus]